MSKLLFSRNLVLVVRSLLGLTFVVFGLNGFFHFLPLPAPPPGPAAQLAAGLAASGYFVPLQKGIEVAAGLLLLAGVWVPLTLAVLAPIVVSVFAFHLFLVPQGMPVAIFLLAAEIHLACVHRTAFAALFRPRPRATQ
jgi:putative oxidoreductase